MATCLQTPPCIAAANIEPANTSCGQQRKPAFPVAGRFCAVVAPYSLSTRGHVGLQAVYRMPTREGRQPHESIPMALRAVFYKVSGGLVHCFCVLLHLAGAEHSICHDMSGSRFLLLVALCVPLRLALQWLCCLF